MIREDERWETGASAATRESELEEESVVAVVQQLLRAHGHHTVPVDGIAGSATEVALRHFQEHHRLPVSGRLDAATIAELRGEHHHEPRPIHHPVRPISKHPGRGHLHPTHPVRRPHHGQHPTPPGPHPSPPAPLPVAPRFPLNRVLTLLGPYLAILAGGVAAWTSQNFPGLDVQQPTLTAGITQGITFVVTTVLTWAMHHKYLDGWQHWERDLLAAQSAERLAAQAAGGVSTAPLSSWVDEWDSIADDPTAQAAGFGPVDGDDQGNSPLGGNASFQLEALVGDGGAGRPGDG